MQIDWLTGSVQTPPELSPGYDIGSYLRLGPGGELLRSWAAKETVRDDEGSSSRNVTVWTPTAGKLFISGNPVKLLQGHNAFGSCDALGLYLAAGSFVRQHAGWFPGADTWRSCQFAGPHFTRIDLTRSYRFPSVAYANAWLRDVASTARDRRGGSLMRGGTVYFGKTSTRWTLKLYEKHGELLKRAREKGGAIPAGVLEWSAGVVRFELTLRTPELEKWPDQVERLRGKDARAAALQLWESYHQRVTWNGNADMSEPDLIEDTLPGHLRVKLAAWRSGADMRALLKKSQFYAVRRELLGAVGVDIASPPIPVGGTKVEVSSGLDPLGWDPEPLAAHYREPEGFAESYRLL